MKTEYTKRQLDAAASLYREQERECRKLDAEAEELLKDGDYLQREHVLKKTNDERRVLDGMKAMAEAVGIPGDALVRASGQRNSI